MKLNKIREKLEALKRLKDNAGTEAEALNAAEKIQDILIKYNLSLTEADLMEQVHVFETFDLGTKKAPDYIHSILGGVAGLCNVLRWTNRKSQGQVCVYFGRRHETEAAAYLHEIIMNALKKEERAFKKTEYYKNLRDQTSKRLATDSFRTGMARRIGERLREMKEVIQQDPNVAGLVRANMAELHNALIEFGVYIKTSRTKKPWILPEAFERGTSAANSTTLNKGVNTNERSQKFLG